MRLRKGRTFEPSGATHVQGVLCKNQRFYQGLLRDLAHNTVGSVLLGHMGGELSLTKGTTHACARIFWIAEILAGGGAGPDLPAGTGRKARRAGARQLGLSERPAA